MDYSEIGKPKKPTGKNIPEAELKPVAAGTRKKKTIKDDVTKVGGYLLTETIIPSAKRLLSEFVSRGVEMLLFKGDSPPSGSGFGFGSGYTNYNKLYGAPSILSSVTGLPALGNPLDLGSNPIDNIVVRTYSEGQNLLKRIGELIGAYGTISIYQVCKLAGLKPKYTDYDWGWTDIRGAQIIAQHGSYLVKLPPPISLR